MKYINYVINAYILLVTVLPIWLEYILADVPYKISQEKETGHNLYHFHPHQMTIWRQVLNFSHTIRQKDWDKCTKAAITKEFFPKVKDRLKMKISINPNFTAMVTGHGRTRAYRYRFKLIDNAACPCNKEDQTVDHLIHQCTLLHTNNNNWRQTSNELGTGQQPNRNW